MQGKFFNHALQNASGRIATGKSPARFLLDKNEQSEDVDIHIKQQVLESLLKSDWNRYPNPDLSDIEANVAGYCGVLPENIVLSPGSASMITTLLNYFALNQKKINIVQPSYSLFDYHCKTYNIPYRPWQLNKDLAYDFENIPKLDSESVLIITTPNNPVGNTLREDQLVHLLESAPESLIIVDGVYCEFSETDFTPLIQKYPNLVILRSFSKAFPIAGLRLGYLCANPKMAALIKKLVLPFSINPLTLVFAREVLFTPEFMRNAQESVRTIIRERNTLYSLLTKSICRSVVHTFKSEGNFLLIRVLKEAHFEPMMTMLSKHGIKVLNASNTPDLFQTFRVSIGSTGENDIFGRIMIQFAEDVYEQARAEEQEPIFALDIPSLTMKLQYA
jgi:histidinol-phosphate aminotransferase